MDRPVHRPDGRRVETRLARLERLLTPAVERLAARFSVQVA
jgi:hypothetical protein